MLPLFAWAEQNRGDALISARRMMENERTHRAPALRRVATRSIGMQVELPRFYVDFRRSHILLDGDSLVGAEASLSQAEIVPQTALRFSDIDEVKCEQPDEEL